MGRDLTCPYRFCITSFPQLNRISQSGRDTFFYFMFSLTFKAFVMFLTFLLFQSNLHVLLACGKGPINRVQRKLKKHKQKNLRPPGAFYRPYGAWIGLLPHWFFQMPQKRHLSKISSYHPGGWYLILLIVSVDTFKRVENHKIIIYI